MNLISAVFSVARQIDDSNLDEINKLESKAQSQVITYHSEMKGLKGLYVKLHKGWIFQTLLIFAVPFITTYFLSLKNRVYSKMQNPVTFDDSETEEYDDDDEREYFEELKRKYEKF